MHVRYVPLSVDILFAYIPPNSQHSVALGELFQYFRKVEANSKKVLIMGDLNSRIGTSDSIPLSSRDSMDPLTNSKGKALLSHVSECSLQIANGNLSGDEKGHITFIHPVHQETSVVDLTLYTPACSKHITGFQVLNWSYSPHFPILLTMPHGTQPKPMRSLCKKLIPPLSPHAKAQYCEAVDVKLTCAPEYTEPYPLYAHIHNTISSVCKDHGLIQEAKSINVNHKARWYDKECKTAHWVKACALRSWRRAKLTNPSKPELLKRYIQANTAYGKLCENKREMYSQRCQAELLATRNNQTFWARVKSFNFHADKPCVIPKLAWHSHYSTVFAPPTHSKANVFTTIPANYINHAELESEFTQAEVSHQIQRMKANKAPRSDLIPNELWKLHTPSLILHLTTLFTMCLNTGTIPREWCKSTVVPLLKKGDPSMPSNYRPIFLLNTILKMFTGVLNSRLSEWITKNHKLSEYQAGFRSKRGCVEHIFMLACMVQGRLSKEKELYTCFVDLSQAFDSPNHELLWETAKEFGLPPKFVRVFQYLYQYATAVIKSPDGTTDPIQIMKGVLQGESASPNLFNIFIDGIVDELYSAPMLTGIKLHTRIIHILLFADDMVLVASTAATLQRKINIAKRFFKRRGLKVNLSKTKIVVFRKSGRIHKDDILYLGNRRIDCVKEYTYLGAPFFSNGSFKLTAEHFKDRGLAVQGRVLSILNLAKSYDISLSCKLFETMVRSTSLYAVEVWGFEQADTLEKVQQSFFKRSLSLPRNTTNYFLKLETGRLHTSYTVFKSMYRFWMKILGSGNGSLLMDSYMHLRSLDPTPVA